MEPRKQRFLNWTRDLLDIICCSSPAPSSVAMRGPVFPNDGYSRTISDPDSIPSVLIAEHTTNIDRTKAERADVFPDWLHHLGQHYTFHSSPEIKLFSGGPMQVPKQVKYAGDAPIITDELADTPASHLGIIRVLQEINRLTQTSLTLQMPSIADILDTHISSGADFGTIYGHVRGWWADFEPNRFFPSLETLFRYWQDKDVDLRTNALKGDVITGRVPPRRVWDLYSNRVVPYYAIPDQAKGLPPGWEKDNKGRVHIWPISHSWMPESNRVSIRTPINNNAWPVPIPDDVSLSNVRIELLNYGASYVWLDVLCLRQSAGPNRDPSTLALEELRLEEWKLDVPTIGSIYTDFTAHRISTVRRLNPRTIIYYSGLGKPFAVGDLDHERHWLNRAWTLQETPGIRSYNHDLPKMDISAGWTPYSPRRPRLEPQQLARRRRTISSGPLAPPVENRFTSNGFFDRLDLVTRRGDIIGILSNMRTRSSVNPVDKIAGLAFLLGASTYGLPIYSPDESAEHAWERLLNVIGPEERGVLLFMYPAPGDGRERLCTPSWDQVLNGVELTREDNSLGPWARVSVGKDGMFFTRASYFKNVFLSGFSTVSTGAGSQSSTLRKGTFKVRSVRDGQVHVFETFTPEWHQHPIPESHEGEDGVYYLIASRNYQHWIIGMESAGSGGDTNSITISKISVLQTAVFPHQSTEEEDRFINFRNLTESSLIKFK